MKTNGLSAWPVKHQSPLKCKAESRLLDSTTLRRAADCLFVLLVPVSLQRWCFYEPLGISGWDVARHQNPTESDFQHERNVTFRSALKGLASSSMPSVAFLSRRETKHKACVWLLWRATGDIEKGARALLQTASLKPGDPGGTCSVAVGLFGVYVVLEASCIPGDGSRV